MVRTERNNKIDQVKSGGFNVWRSSCAPGLPGSWTEQGGEGVEQIKIGNMTKNISGI